MGRHFSGGRVMSEVESAERIAAARSLAASLAQYVRADDVSLSRELFLRLVLNRIVDDLSARLRFQLRDNNKEQL
jgi:phosphoribosylamine-glycine ligase